jgi:hypothetical protein
MSYPSVALYLSEQLTLFLKTHILFLQRGRATEENARKPQLPGEMKDKSKTMDRSEKEGNKWRNRENMRVLDKVG